MIRFDKYATPLNIFRTHGDELFPVLFKLTFFNDKQYSVANMPPERLRVLEHEELLAAVEKVEMQAAKVNIVVNNILLQQVFAMDEATEDVRKKLATSLVEETYGDEKIKSNKRLSRLLLLMAVLFDRCASGRKESDLIS